VDVNIITIINVPLTAGVNVVKISKQIFQHRVDPEMYATAISMLSNKMSIALVSECYYSFIVTNPISMGQGNYCYYDLKLSK
jgi:hypothetical protein